MNNNGLKNIAEFLDSFEKDRPYLDELEDFEYYSQFLNRDSGKFLHVIPRINQLNANLLLDI
jgi:hypothetical protein